MTSWSKSSLLNDIHLLFLCVWCHWLTFARPIRDQRQVTFPSLSWFCPFLSSDVPHLSSLITHTFLLITLPPSFHLRGFPSSLWCHRFYTEGRITDRVKVTLSWGEPTRYSNRLTPELPEGVSVQPPPGISWKYYTCLMSLKRGFKRKRKEELIFNKCKQPFQPEIVNKSRRKRLRLPLWELQGK